MLFTSDSFAAYDSQVFNYLPKDSVLDFKPGIYGLTLEQVSKIEGLGARVLVELGTMLGIEPDTTVLKFNIESNLTTKYTISPKFAKDKREDGEVHIYFVVGDYKITIPDLFDIVKGFTFYPELITVKVGTEEKQYPAFTFEKSAAGLVKNDKNKYSFVVSNDRSNEHSLDELVKLFDTATDPELLYKQLVEGNLVGGINDGVSFAKLKELALGGYEISNIQWEDKTVEIKNGAKAGQTSRIQNWKFTAKSLSTGVSYVTSASPESFVGKAIKQNDKILKIAGKDIPGAGKSVVMIIESITEVPQGVSVKGKIFDNHDLGLIVAQAFTSRLNQAQQQATATAQITTATPAQLKSAEPASTNGTKPISSTAAGF
jgi:hypothetical protein